MIADPGGLRAQTRKDDRQSESRQTIRPTRKIDMISELVGTRR